jgi:uncharacterized paraquat-inducible protein A
VLYIIQHIRKNNARKCSMANVLKNVTTAGPWKMLDISVIVTIVVVNPGLLNITII